MIKPVRPRRSVLYMPGSNARALEKIRTLSADGYILDLEDAVAPDAKDIARQQVCAALKAGGFTMQASENISVDLVLVVQSLIVLFLAAPPLVRAIFRLPNKEAK